MVLADRLYGRVIWKEGEHGNVGALDDTNV
jgi:hypothetical protein